MQRVEHALQVDRVHFVPLRLGHFEKSLAGVDARVIDQHIDAAEIACRAFHPLGDVTAPPHVAAESGSGTARRDDGFGNPLATCQVPIEQVRMRALTGKEACNRLADSGGGARNQCDPILQHGNMITRWRVYGKEMWSARERRMAFWGLL